MADNVFRHNYSMMQILKKIWENFGVTQAYILKLDKNKKVKKRDFSKDFIKSKGSTHIKNTLFGILGPPIFKTSRATTPSNEYQPFFLPKIIVLKF